MTKHTKEPWQVPHLARDDTSCNCAHIFAADYLGGIAEVYVDNGKPVSDGGNDCPPLEEAKANARRIVACVNACAGISTEQLEAGEQPWQSAARHKELRLAAKTAEAQRDELLAALVCARRLAAERLSVQEQFTIDDLIAKARGEQL